MLHFITSFFQQDLCSVLNISNTLESECQKPLFIRLSHWTSCSGQGSLYKPIYIQAIIYSVQTTKSRCDFSVFALNLNYFNRVNCHPQYKPAALRLSIRRKQEQLLMTTLYKKKKIASFHCDMCTRKVQYSFEIHPTYSLKGVTNSQI